jgi:predicted PurR-regulated permease PerM
MSGVVTFIDLSTKVLHLILMVFFLMAVGNSIWSWLVDVVADKSKSKNTQMK